MSEGSIEVVKPRLRLVLLALQILMPFGLYLAMQAGSQPLAVLISALFAVSMLVLVWLG